MPAVIPTLLCGVLAAALWGGPGWVLARRIFPDRTLAILVAPTIGWAAQTSLAHGLSLVFGASTPTYLCAAMVVAMAAAIDRKTETGSSPSAALWPLLALACLMALLPMAGELPKVVEGGVQFAGPVFDHAKIAVIDEMLRTGVPPGNPVFAMGGGAGLVSYYYFWLFGAAELGHITGASGWEADIASSWFTAFASLLLIGGIAFQISRRLAAVYLAVLFALIGSLRPALAWVIGQPTVDGLLRHQTGLANWLLETSWSPHHVMAAGCAVIALLLMGRLAERTKIATTLLLALVVNAGFQSSLWVGGITFGLCGIVAGMMFFFSIDRDRRIGFVLSCAAAAILAAGLSWPLISLQIDAAAQHVGRSPIMLNPARIFGPEIPDGIRRIVDVPAYWLVYLPIEFPVAFLVGGWTLWRRALARSDIETATRMVRILGAAALVSLLGGGWLLSTIGINNDLGWRAVLPAVLLLNAAAGAGIAEWLSRRRFRPLAVSAALLLTALPDTGKLVNGNIAGNADSRSAAFAPSAEMWAAVRKYAGPQDRVANNPIFLAELTPWPINLSWALLADRRSCFGGKEMAIAFTPLSADQRQQVSDLFIAVFDGRGSPEDVARLANDYGCGVAVVTPLDGAWSADLFAMSPLYRLAESKAGKWRIYVLNRPID